MRGITALTALALAGSCAANPILDAATAELHARIKAIDESSFYNRIMSFTERRKLSNSMGTLSRVSDSMSTMFSRIASENINSATEVIDTLKQEFCIGAASNADSVANISSWIISSQFGSSVQSSVGLTPAQIGYDGMISQFLTGCLCTTTWKLDQPEVTALWTSVVGLTKPSGLTNAEKRADLIANIKLAAPILSGPNSFCADSCKTSIVAIFDLLFALVPKIALPASVSSGGGSMLGKWGPGKDTGIPTSIALPANSAAQAKLGADLYGCLCTGWEWGALADAFFNVPWYMIFGGSPRSAIYATLGGIGEGTIAGGSPWIGASYAAQATTAGWANTASDPALVIDTATTNIAVIRSSLCAAGCLTFLTDFLTLGLHTAAEYYWPSLVTGLITDATSAQVPSEAKIAGAMNTLPNCMCNMNLTLAKETLYPKLSYLLTGATNPYPDSLAMISNLTYSGASTAFCNVSNCSGFLGSFAKLFTPAAELVLATPGAILSGNFYKYASSGGSSSSTLLATDPPIVSKGTLSSAQMDTFFDNVMPCMCHHADPASGARDMITWAANAMFNNKSFTSKSLQPSFAQTLQPFIKKAMLGSKYCGHDSCRAVVQVLKDHMTSMLTTTETTGTCTAANVAKCRGGGTEPADEVCSTPIFGAKASQKFPLRWLDLSDAPTEVRTINDEFIYWELCSAVTECAQGGPQFFEIMITFTIDATVETFDKNVFKVKLANFLNADVDTAESVTANDITLKVTAGSIKVEATIKAYAQSVKSAIVKSLNAATPAALEAALGVKVLGTSSATVTMTTVGGVTTGAIVGIVVGVVAVLLLIVGAVAFWWFKIKGKAPKEPKTVEVVTTTESADNEAPVSAADGKI